jgi:arginyl-tRNA--protein-N-Asp/Glu arginylyltransferase
MRQQQISLLLTPPHPCSYLEDRDAITAFVAPDTAMSPALFTRLTELGFRRSGQHVYRPQCVGCNACTPIRLRVEDFEPNRSQRRCLKQNEDLTVRPLVTIDDAACYALYARYIHTRHGDGDMFPPSEEQYEGFLCSRGAGCFYLGFFAANRLLAVAVCDQFLNGTSAVYTFYDPDEETRRLGVYAILTQIARTRLMQLDYLYLGYWIRDCRKMAYKTQYKPYELLLDGHWQPIL